jgi:CofD-related protein of GAK system
MIAPEPRPVSSARAPEAGPTLLFFSGGTALRGVSRALPRFTHNSVHVITPFDSGGSSAELRRAFAMPAVGDLRNRLLALAYSANGGQSAAWTMAWSRFGRDRDPDLRAHLDAMCDGSDSLMAAVPEPEQSNARHFLSVFRANVPTGFDLRGASLGNLLITGSWLENGHRLAPALSDFSRLVGARGTVLPVVDEDLHLAAELDDGRCLLGQHRITGKEVEAIGSPVRRLWLTRPGDEPRPAATGIDRSLADRITDADLVCFPMGSFYSSIIANLLPSGIGSAVASAGAPRVYVPNLGHDPESLGLGVADATLRLVDYLQRDLAAPSAPPDVLDCVLVDTANGDYPEPEGLSRLDRLGIRVIDRPLVTPDSAPLIEENLLIEALMSLAEKNLLV